MTTINKISNISSSITTGNTYVNDNIIKCNSGDFTISAANSSDIILNNGTDVISKFYFDGSATYPLNPAFLAYTSSNQTNVTGNGTEWTVVLDTEVFDTNGDFASNTFTAPRDCVVLLKACVSCSGVTGSNLGLLNFIYSVGNRSRITWNVATIADGSGNNANIYYSNVIDLDQGDTVQLVFEIEGLAGDTATVNGGSSPIKTWWAGYIVS